MSAELFRAADVLARVDPADPAALATAQETLAELTAGRAPAWLTCMANAAIAGRRDLGDQDAERVVAAILTPVCADYADASAEWGEMVSLGPPEPTPLPIDALPKAVRAHVASVAGATQTPPDMSALLSLAAVSVAVQGKAEVHVRPGWTEPINIYCAAVLPPATRKSSTYRHIFQPLEAWEAEQARELAPKCQAAEDQRQVLEKRLEAAKRDAAAGKVPTELVEAARLELLEARVEPVTRLNAPDASPEALVNVMFEQGGRIGVLAPEGDPLRILDGRYSGHGDARLDTMKRAWSGEAIRVDRIQRQGQYIRRPALTLALCLQPTVLETLRNAKSFRGEGVLGRILWVIPDSGVGERLTGADVPLLAADAAADWDRLLRRVLASRPADVDEDGTYVPHRLSLTDEARDVLYSFEAEVEGEIGFSGSLGAIADWAGKLVGQAVRLAVLLDVAARADDGVPLFEPVTGWAMNGAVLVARALSTHALQLFAALDRQPELILARRVLDRLCVLPENTSVRDLFNSIGKTKGLTTVKDLKGVLEVMEDHRLIRMHQRVTDRPGRPASPVVELHPEVRRIRKTPVDHVGDGDSADIADSSRPTDSSADRSDWDAIEL